MSWRARTGNRKGGGKPTNSSAIGILHLRGADRSGENGES